MSDKTYQPMPALRTQLDRYLAEWVKKNKKLLELEAKIDLIRAELMGDDEG